MIVRSVLIVEDNATKRQEIERTLRSRFEADVQATSSIAQAYRALAGKPYELIVLDMTFQISQSAGHETSKEAIAGIELLQYVTRRRIRASVIVATQHSTFSTREMPGIDSIEKLHALLTRLFPECYRTTVQVDLSEETWKIRFLDAVAEALGEPLR